jgi:hypothetical protein
MTRLLKLSFTCICAALLAATAAYGAGVAMAVDVTNSQITMVGGTGGTCEWTVVSTVTLVNLTSDPVEVTMVEAHADYNDDATLIGRTEAEILGNGGLTAGIILAPNAIASFPGVQTRSFIPCAATYAQIEFRVSSPDSINAGDAPFLENGTPVPFRTVAGALVVTGVLATGMALHQRRRPASRVLTGATAG